jgi:hypothetical protein
MITKFTTTQYPNGYSRKVCQDQLRLAEAQLKEAHNAVRELAAEIKKLQKKLKQGGRTE